jgi:hypothetical protein
MIRNASENDFNDIYNVINDAAIAYKGMVFSFLTKQPQLAYALLKSEVRRCKLQQLLFY